MKLWMLRNRLRTTTRRLQLWKDDLRESGDGLGTGLLLLIVAYLLLVLLART